MKKFLKIISIIIFLLLVITKLSLALENTGNLTIFQNQKDSIGVNEFLRNSESYTKNLEGIDINEILTSALSGKIDNKKILRSVLLIFGGEINNAIKIFGSILIIIIINGILNAITDGLNHKSISKIAFYIQYIVITTIILANFSEIIFSIKECVNNLKEFSYMLIPILMTLIITTGSVTSAGMLEPILVFMISLISNFINNIAIPIVLAATSIGIISKISNRAQLERLSKRLKSGIVWVLGVVLTVFVTLVSVDGTLSSSVDAVTSKTAKAAVSNLIPVVGKILGDAVDSVIGCSSILKNAVGIVGMVIVIAISIAPIAKLTIYMLVYYLGSALCEPIADEKIVKLLDLMGDTFKILLALLCSMSVMIIIGTTLVIKISNAGGIN